MQLKRNLSFLFQVFIYTITSFGGPQVHLAMLNRIFVKKRKDLSEDELMDFYAFCQLLPGATSTQLLGLIGFKKGGFYFSLLVLIIWIIPACIIMCLLSFYTSDESNNYFIEKSFVFFPAMTIGFLLFTAWNLVKSKVKNVRMILFISGSTIISSIFFKIPWIFPILIVSGGILNSFLAENKLFNQSKTTHKKPNFIFLFVFICLFILLGSLSETARKNHWNTRTSFNLSENFYRFGSIVFGGGEVLLPMILDQYVARPTDSRIIQRNPNLIRLTKNEVLIGYGLVKAIPGPVFSIGSYISSVSLQKEKISTRVIGSFIGTISLFLPGILLMYFFFPLWQYGKKYSLINRGIEGVSLVAIGFILSAAFYLLVNSNITHNKTIFYKELIFIISTILLLNYSKIPTPLIVVSTLIIGYFTS
jgi:chromate transporter